MSERDPRVDPKPGDVLRAGKWTRNVLTIGQLYGWPKSVRYGRKCATTGHVEVRHCATPEGWQRWARNAEVLEADNENDHRA